MPKTETLERADRLTIKRSLGGFAVIADVSGGKRHGFIPEESVPGLSGSQVAVILQDEYGCEVELWLSSRSDPKAIVFQYNGGE